MTNACRISKQWILLPLAIGKLKLTKATVLGLGMPRGGSKDAMKSESCEKAMNWPACGSYLGSEYSHYYRVVILSITRRLLAPADVEHLQIVLDDPYLFFLVCLIEILENDGDIHVNNDHIVDDDEASKVDYR